MVKANETADEVKYNNFEKHFAMGGMYCDKIDEYIENTFKKSVSVCEIITLSLMQLYYIISVENDEDKELLLSEMKKITTDKSNLNEYIFTSIATIKAWNETAFALKGKENVSETEFDELMEKNNEIFQYKAWNDERKVLEKFHAETDAADGGD